MIKLSESNASEPSSLTKNREHALAKLPSLFVSRRQEDAISSFFEIRKVKTSSVDAYFCLCA